MLEGSGGEPRYRMLETLREFGLEQLAACGEDETTRRRHAAHYLALGQRVEENPSGPSIVPWLGMLDVEHPNLRSALAWLLEHEQSRHACDFPPRFGRSGTDSVIWMRDVDGWSNHSR